MPKTFRITEEEKDLMLSFNIFKQVVTFQGDDVTTQIVIPHNLGRIPIPSVTRNDDPEGNLFNAKADINNITITFFVGPPMTGNTILLNVVGF